MTRLPPIAININFDSLTEAFGFPKGFYDPSYFEAFDRFIDLANKQDLKITMYIIAKDLENPEIAARVADWHSSGHEISSHSWSHQMNLGALSSDEIYKEIYLAHEKITNTIQTTPKGFTAPAWATSKDVVCHLIDLGYEYDASVFPSPFLYPMMLKIFMNHLNMPKKAVKAFQRRDWIKSFTAPRKPFYTNKDFDILHTPPTQQERGRLFVMPLPTTGGIFNLPLWHTVGFVFNWDNYMDKVRNALKQNYYYYLLHPGDFLIPEDLDPKYRHGLERTNIDLATKMARLENVFDAIKRSGRAVVTMSDLSKELQHQYKSL